MSGAPVSPRSPPACPPPARCSLCNAHYTRPKQLPCLHTFCAGCLQEFVNPRLLVECPSCRTQTQLTVAGVAGLPDNLAVGVLVVGAGRAGAGTGEQRRQLQHGFSQLDTAERELASRVEAVNNLCSTVPMCYY